MCFELVRGREKRRAWPRLPDPPALHPNTRRHWRTGHRGVLSITASIWPYSTKHSRSFLNLSTNWKRSPRQRRSPQLIQSLDGNCCKRAFWKLRSLFRTAGFAPKRITEVCHLQLIKLKRVIWLVEDCILLIVDRKIGLIMVKYCRTYIRLLDDYRPIVLLLKFSSLLKDW